MTAIAVGVPVTVLGPGFVLVGTGAAARVVTVAGTRVRFDHPDSVTVIELLAAQPDGVTARELWAGLWPNRGFHPRLIAGIGFDIRVHLGKRALRLPRPSNQYHYQLTRTAPAEILTAWRAAAPSSSSA